MRRLLIGLVLAPALASADFGAAESAVNQAASTGSLESAVDALRQGVSPSTGAGLGIGTVPCGEPDARGQYRCGGQVIDQPTESPPEAANYDKTVGEIQSDAQAKMVTDDAGSLVLTSKVERPTGVVKVDDPLFSSMAANDTAASGLAETYTGCRTLTYGGTGGVTKTTAFGYKTGASNSVRCTRSWTEQCDWHEGVVFTQGAGEKLLEYAVYRNAGNGGVTRNASMVEYTHYKLNNTTDFTVTLDGRAELPEALFYVVYDLWVGNSDSKWDKVPSLWINGVQVPGTTHYWPIGSKYWTYIGTFDNISNYLKEGGNTIHLATHGGGITSEMIYNMHNIHECIGRESESFTCDNITTIGNKPLISKTCTDDKNPKWFDGAAFTRACWSQNEVYGYANTAVFKEDAQCEALRKQGCYVANEECLTRAPEGFCANAKLTFTCDAKSSAQTVDICGDTLICTDGSCNQGAKTVESPAQDFSRTATYLQVMKDAKNNFDPASFSVFKGTYHECSVEKTVIGTNKCCTGGSGTLNDLGLANCSTEEKFINQSRNAAVVTALPGYETCGASALGQCLKKVVHYSYCVWPSKLARIIQDQGKAQIGLSIGSDCTGFKLDSPNELEKVDFSRIDLSDYFSDVQQHYDAASKPSPDALIMKMQQKMPDLTKEMTDRYKDYGQ